MKSPKDYFGNFSYANKKGYSGVGIYSKERPNKVINKIGIPEMDDEGRYIEIDLDKIVIISVYLPSGSSGEERQLFKYKVLDKMLVILKKKIKLGKNIVVCGDFNIAHHEIDLKNFKGNKKNSGFLPEERAWLSHLFSKVGWVDVYRNLYSNKGEEGYTWWSNRGQAWAKNVGWRIDYQIANLELAANAQMIESPPLSRIYKFWTPINQESKIVFIFITVFTKQTLISCGAQDSSVKTP